MALRLKNRVQETTATTGTGTVTLSGTAPTGFQTFSNALSDGDTTYYQITDGTDWEIGLGTFVSATNELQRTDVFESTNSDAKVNWVAGDKDVFIVFPASKVHATDAYTQTSDLPLTGNVVGDQAYVTGNNTLYVWNGGGWYAIAAINLTPTITTQPDANYGLSTDGSALQVTVEATDPEGFPITWSANTTGMTGLATLSQANNVFTFTPSTDVADQGQSFTATFSASDGTNTAVTNLATFTIGIDALSSPSVGTITITSADGTAVFISGLSELWKDVDLSIGTSSTNSLGNGSFVDRGANSYSYVGKWGTPEQTAVHPYLDNWSVETFGSEWIQTPSTQSAFDFSAGGDFTIELWAKDKLTSDGVRPILNVKAGAYGFLFRRYSANRWELYYSGSSRTYLNIADYGGYTDWYHFAITVESGTLRWFVNGVEAFTTTSISASNYNYTTLDIGSYAGSYFQGYFSNVRVVKGTALYTADFTPPTEKLTAVSGTTFLGYQSSQFIDNSGNNEPINVSNGSPEPSPVNPFGQEDEYAPGENKGSVDFATTDGLDLQVRTSGTVSTWAMEFWYKFDPTSTIDQNHYLIDARGTAGSQSQGSLYLYRNSTTTYSDSSNYGVTDDNFNDGGWHWFVMVCDGTNRAIWIDGVRIAQLGGTKTVGSHLWINSRNTNQYHNVCQISDFRFSTTARYATSSTSISVPTSPVGIDNDTSAYYPFDNAGIFDKAGNHTLALFGNTSTSTTQTKFASTSIYSGGTGDYIEVPWYDALGSNDFTIESWIYIVSSSDSYGRIVESGAYNTNDTWRIIYNNTASTLVFQIGNTSTRPEITTTTALQGAWHHIAVCRDGNTIRFFVDGTQEGGDLSYSGSLIAPTNIDAILFGTGVTSATNSAKLNYHNGYIENFQILKGVAKYTANFTPPLQEQGLSYQKES